MSFQDFEWLYLPYALPQFLTVIVGLLLAIFVWRSPSSDAIKRTFSAFIAAAAVWALMYGFELLSPDLDAKKVWARLEYVGIAYTSTFWLIYALVYREQDSWLQPGWVAAICLIPTITQFMVWSNDSHHFYWTSLSLDTSGPIPLLVTTRGPWFWVQLTTSYFYVVVGTLVLVLPALRSASTFRAQSLTVIGAALLPLIGNVVYVSQIIPTRGLNPTPLLFSISGVLLIFSGTRFALFDLTPTANRLVLSNMQDGVFVVDHLNRFISVNPAAERILGQPESAIIGKSINDVFQNRFPALLERYQTVDEIRDELEIPRANNIATYDVRISTMYGPSGSRRGRIAVLRDITQQKHIMHEVDGQRKFAQALRESAEAINSSLELEAVLDKILELVELVVPYETSSLFLIEDDNALVSRTRSSNPDKQGLAESLVGLRYDLDKTITLQTQRETGEALLIDDVREFEGWVSLPSNHWVRSYLGVPITIGSESIGFLNLYGTTTHIYTEQDADRLKDFAVQAALAIRNARSFTDREEQNKRLIMLSLIATIGTVDVPAEDLIRMLAEAAAMMIEADTAFITRWDERTHKTVPITATGGLHDLYVALPEPYPGQPSVTESVIRRGQMIVVDDVFNSEHISPQVASRFPTRSMLGLPLYANDEPFGALLLGFNTPHTFSESELVLADQAANLMALVITKAMSLEELQLRNRELDAFSHTVAHDLKAPLQGITGYLELIRMTADEALPPDAEDHINAAMRFTLKIGGIVDAMMLLAGLREQEYEPEVVKITPVIQSAIDRFQLDIAETGVRFVLQDDYPDVMGHGPWVEEVFANLISNSIKYMGAGKKTPTITISARRQADRVTYEVSDNGVGISEEKLPTVFHLFSRFHQSLAEGTGLGMSIVQRIINRMDGEIGIESTPGEGTTVWFILNAPPTERDDPSLSASPGSASA